MIFNNFLAYYFLAGAALISSVTGGGNDLLDYMTVKAYWQAKNVTVTVAAMEGEMAPPKTIDVSKLIDDLSSADSQVRADTGKKLVDDGAAALPALQAAADSGDPQVSSQARELIEQIKLVDKPGAVRRLMAIRALGESGSDEARAFLKALPSSDRPFENDYTAWAIARLSHLPATRPALAEELRGADAYDLPEDCGAVVQVTAHDGHPIPLEALVKKLQQTGFGADQFQQFEAQLVTVAEKLGNVRFEEATIGVSDSVSDQVGFVVWDVRLQYDAKAAAAYLAENDVKSKTVGNQDVYLLGEDAWLLMPSNDRCVIIAGPKELADETLQRVLDSVMSDKQGLHAAKDIGPLVESVDKSGPVWAAMTVTPSYKQAPAFAPFDSATLESHKVGDEIDLTYSARGTDASGTAAVVRDSNDTLSQMLSSARDGVKMMPALKPVVDILESVKVAADGGNMTIAAEAPNSLLDAIANGPDTTEGGADATQPATQPAP